MNAAAAWTESSSFAEANAAGADGLADGLDAQDHSVAIIGAGPRGLSVLERLVALTAERFAGTDAPPTIVVHLIDPYPPGAGIIWRTDQPETLLMNTTIAEQTVFPDSSCSFLSADAAGDELGSDAAASHFGPDMAQWYRDGGGTDPVDATFPSRRLYGRYLRDAYARVRDTAPDFVEIVEHLTKVESVIDLPPVEPLGHTPTDPERVPPQLVRCEDGTTIITSAVVLAVGHIPSAQTEERARLAAFAQRSGGRYIPQGLPADAPVAEVAPGSRVIVRGMGLNYFDLQTLFTHERGGRFEPDLDVPGELRYVRSGEEPRLLLGSRRGVPYRSKPICPAHPRSPWPLRYFTKDNIALLAGLEGLDGERKAGARFNDQLWPLILADLRLAYYSTLARIRPAAFAGDPGQLREAIAEAVSRHLTRRTWQETHPESHESSEARSQARTRTADAEAARQGRVTREAFAWSEIEESLVPDPAHRMSLHELLNPLEGRQFDSRGARESNSLHEWMLDFLRTDLHDSLAGPESSAEKSLFTVLWQARLLLKELIVAGHIDRVSIDMEICGWFESFVSGICDGPPPQRIAELLALAEAGLVEFIGPDMRIEANPNVVPSKDADAAPTSGDGAPTSADAAAPTSGDGAPPGGSSAFVSGDPLPQIFTVTSAQVEGRITGSVVIDAASPTNAVSRAADVLVHGMVERGQLTPARLTLDDGREKFLNGLALTQRPYRTIDVDGTVHPRRFALSIQLSSVQWGLAIAANPNTNAATLADSHAAAAAILDLV
ncbi:MAG: FAD/NAD(P)-binding protein [Brevibacterium sp.]|uniref:FAD/NAD(P)-binding protein n=1 Tax=Brevibacterium sp. TaxID=1701 RepID=UPI0026484654|nr:FAD/NAD(P)-binding protein [Brevibacterium sp.]MDN5807183.1 FAD/NAD(P)-binding protein [Brevibacterium sp.]MDN5833171.1 FAD/NAD(P)-binding protein [Brevibacterium sp.]MDN5877258.1 FAD/NAD(P)-binding protein [Brevibacterium sp.]MDN5909611.1 FAD/NAD(P)-binding protein [Brevibacterium sp.]MDN6189175.1 FAD/NAD(P)-binding protein [Brevibacterium sp.]